MGLGPGQAAEHKGVPLVTLCTRAGTRQRLYEHQLPSPSVSSESLKPLRRRQASSSAVACGSCAACSSSLQRSRKEWCVAEYCINTESRLSSDSNIPSTRQPAVLFVCLQQPFAAQPNHVCTDRAFSWLFWNTHKQLTWRQHTAFTQTRTCCRGPAESVVRRNMKEPRQDGAPHRQTARPYSLSLSGRQCRGSGSV